MWPDAFHDDAAQQQLLLFLEALWYYGGGGLSFAVPALCLLSVILGDWTKGRLVIDKCTEKSTGLL